MALLPGGSFRTEDAPASSFDPIPEGQYTVMVKDSEVKETKAGDGQYLKLTFEVAEGEFAGRYLWNLFNLVNPNDKAVEIAQRDLGSLCEACGVEELEDSQELHGIPVYAQIKIQPEQNGFGPSNTISKYEAMN